MLRSVLLILVLLAAAPAALSAQAPATNPATRTQAVETVVAQRNARPQNYVRVVRVPGPSRTGVARQVGDGVTNWQFFARGGYARNRAIAARWRARFRPLPVVRPVVRFAPQVRYNRFTRRAPVVLRRW